MRLELFYGLMLPFLGTLLGSCCVFFMKEGSSERLSRVLTGFAAGVMTAASVWSLIIPSIEHSENMGGLSFFPAAAGFLSGIFFLLVLDCIIPHLHMHSQKAEGVHTGLKRTTMLMFAVTLHNFPEGMAVGAVLAGVLAGDSGISVSAALALSLGIAIQNFPEGAVIAMPLKAEGMKKSRAFASGALSGLAEPVAAALTILLSTFALPILPYLLSFAAGAMIYVVVEELIPEMSQGRHSNLGTVAFALGFCLMMILDVALG